MMSCFTTEAEPPSPDSTRMQRHPVGGQDPGRVSDPAAGAPDPQARLTSGLARNLFSNLLGWAVPVVLAVAAVPIIVDAIGVVAYGVFSLIGVVSGYAAIVNAPAAQGGIRFMADAYARRDWPELRGTAVASLGISTGLALLGALIMLAAADPLVSLFKVPDSLASTSIVAVRLGAVAFLLNGVVQALTSVLAAVRRFELLSMIVVFGRTLATVLVIAAVWSGRGLIGAIGAQIWAAAVSVALAFLIVALELRRLSTDTSVRFPRGLTRRFASFSATLFAGNLGGVIGLQLDRGLVGMFLGPSAAAYYAIPLRLTDTVAGLLSSLGQVLYPLSSEALATGRLSELRVLYIRSSRALAWLAALSAGLLIATSKNLLALWVGGEIARQSWVPLTLLAIAVLWRGPSTVAHRVCIGLNRPDVSMTASYGTVLLIGIPVALLTPRMGITGAALGVLAGTIPINFAYDLYVQRRLLGQRDWRQWFAVYWKPLAALAAGSLAASRVDLEGEWASVIVRASIVGTVFLAGAVTLERALVRDLIGIANRFLVARRRRL